MKTLRARGRAPGPRRAAPTTSRTADDTPGPQDRELQTLRIAGEVFDEIADGGGAIDGPLRSGQRSKRLLLLHELMTTVKARAADVWTTARADDSYAALVDAQREDLDAADAVLLQPHVGAWAMSCLRRLSSHEALPAADLGHLGAVAAAAALRAGCSFEVTVYVGDGSLMLPTYGSALVPDIDGWCRLRGGPQGRDVEIVGPGTTHPVPIDAEHDTPTWRRLRRLRATSGDITFDVALEDLDPYRGCGHLPVADRLDETTYKAWQATFEDTWPLLVADDEARARALVTGVASIVPLEATDAAAELSASCHEAIGAVAMTPPSNPLGLALALVHEHQHNKLSALLDLVPLLQASPDARYRAPWRPDPRPLRGLIQGIYAFFGVTRLWESIRRDSAAWDPRAAEDWAHFEFALGRRQVEFAVTALLGSEHLNEYGERFFRRMHRRLVELPRPDSPPVPLVADRLAELAAADHAIAWRLRNCRPIGTQIDIWSKAFVDEEGCAWNAPEIDLVDGDGPIASTTRLALFRHRLAHPDAWQQRVLGASDGDLALVADEPFGAAESYERQIQVDPGDHAAWAGLALAHRHEATEAAWALASHPELVLALHRAVLGKTGTAAPVTAIADWLGRGSALARSPSRRLRRSSFIHLLASAKKRVNS